jgi:hypothetical protein
MLAVAMETINDEAPIEPLEKGKIYITTIEIMPM